MTLGTLKLSDLKVGDELCIDDGFTCARSGSHEVKEDEGGLYFDCSDGKHYLAGQQDEAGSLVGIMRGPQCHT